jgi:UDP-2,3-diacylglucosamine pyrophosphatase LpxH
MTINTYKSVFISDIHLGTKMCQGEFFLQFLKSFECETLYLVGDIIDGWALSQKTYWPQTHNDVIQKLLRKSRKGTKIVYIPGNHDEFMRAFCSDDLIEFGNIQITDQIIHTSISNKKYLVIHGDQFDAVIKKLKWLAFIGSYAYDLSIKLNVTVNFFRRLFGLPFWSLSAYLKYKVKSAVNFISDYEENLTNYAKIKQCDGIICGHIHHPNITTINNIEYLNCGDWCESLTAIVEHYDGTMELIRWKKS